MAGLIIPAGMVLLVVGILLISILGAVFKQNSANIQKANKLYGICLLVIAGFVILYASIVS